MNPSATVAPENTRAKRLPFAPRGPLSSAVLTYLVRGPGSEVDPELEALAREVVERSPEIALDDDIQVALYALYALYASAYGAFEQFLPDLEWDPGSSRCAGCLRPRTRLNLSLIHI